MGVGKTAVCRALLKKLPNAVFLDGDWCWTSSPFIVNEETKKMVVDNVCHTLRNFLLADSFRNVIFCWVMHEQSIQDDILSRLPTEDITLHKISLVCSEEALRERLLGDIRQGFREEDILERSVARLPLYAKIDSEKIDTSFRSVDAIVEEITGEEP